MFNEKIIFKIKKILFASIIILLTFTTIAFSDAIKKSGFIDPKVKIIKSEEINDPKNKIIIIYNHGQDSLDRKGNGCTWIGSLRNKASLVDNEINGKKIMVYNLCTNKLVGDEGSDWWGSDKIYSGKTKLDKRVEANLELVEKFVSKGVPRKQIFITGHSCGGLTTLLFFARYPDKAGGGISYMHACFGKLSKEYKVKKVGIEKALNKFKKKYPGPYELRERQINEIQNNLKVPLLAFTHPRDKYEGLLSDWMDEMELIDRVVISENFKINGESCKKKHSSETEPVKKGHDMDQGLCFQYYNPKILNYISSRI